MCIRDRPDYEHLHDAYELLWEMPGNDGYLQLVGIMQKFIDHSISANTNYCLLYTSSLDQHHIMRKMALFIVPQCRLRGLV